MSTGIVANVEQTSSPVANARIAEDPKQASQNQVTLQAAVDPIIAREEKIEYRDEKGNILEPNEVSSLEGKVSFSTRYETRTRLVDADGNEVVDKSIGSEGVAPPHPDVDREPETVADIPENDGRNAPTTASPEEDLREEKSINRKSNGEPRPASEAKEATK